MRVHINTTRGKSSPSLPSELLLYVTAGQGHIVYRELAIPAGFMTEPDAGVPTYAYRACAAFVTPCTLVILKIRMALSVREKGEKLHQDEEYTSLPRIGKYVHRKT